MGGGGYRLRGIDGKKRSVLSMSIDVFPYYEERVV